jgi:predicted nucleotidyltransferase component of viral defense system
MLFTKTVAPNTLELLKELMKKPYLKPFVLVGGTGLSLQLGHRISVDLDLFANEDFNTTELKKQLQTDFNSFNTVFERNNSLICEIDGIKTDIIRFKYGFNHSIIVEQGIRIANIKDIAPMKLDALSARGKKKDFYDLYFLIKAIPLTQILDLYKGMYNHTTIFHVIKSINYFVDAEKDPDPIVFQKNLTWQKVKEGIVREIRTL